jgi:hypothetical protein
MNIVRSSIPDNAMTVPPPASSNTIFWAVPEPSGDVRELNTTVVPLPQPVSSMNIKSKVPNVKLVRPMARILGNALRTPELDLGSHLFEGSLDLLGLIFRYTFLDVLWRTLNEILRFLQPEACEDSDFPDHLEFLLANGLENDRERGHFLRLRDLNRGFGIKAFAVTILGGIDTAWRVVVAGLIIIVPLYKRRAAAGQRVEVNDAMGRGC